MVVTSITPKMVSSTAYSVMGYPLNSSSSKETQIQPLAVVAFMEIQSTSNVPDFQAKSTLPFILHLRCVCETIFDVMLSAYISGLGAYHKRSTVNGERQGSKRPSLDGLDRALKSAEDVLAMFRKADDECRGGDVHSANTTVEEALFTLKDSAGAVPTMYHSKLIMSDWDDTEVEKRTVSFF